LKPSEFTLGQLTAESSISLRVSTPDEEMPGGWVAHDAECVEGGVAPTEIRLTILNKYQQISGPFRMKTGVEVFVGCGIARPASNEKYPPEHLDGVLGQIGLSEECASHLVVTDNVPPMQSMLIAQVRDELGDRHASPSPRDGTVRIQVEHVGNEIPHLPFCSVEATKKIVMIHGLEGAFALFKATSLRNRISLQKWVKMPIDLHSNTCDMGGDFMGRPSVA
jgi:hypothetical protein